MTALSPVAQCWMAQERLECWALWIAVDVLFVAPFVSKALYLTVALYALFILLAIHGWRVWCRDPALRKSVAA